MSLNSANYTLTLLDGWHVYPLVCDRPATVNQCCKNKAYFLKVPEIITITCFQQQLYYRVQLQMQRTVLVSD